MSNVDKLLRSFSLCLASELGDSVFGNYIISQYAGDGDNGSLFQRWNDAGMFAVGGCRG